MLAAAPGERFARRGHRQRLGLEKGAHGVAGILAWPGRYSRHLNRVLPIETAGRADGGTDYFMEPDVAELFAAARGARAGASRGDEPGRRSHGAAPREPSDRDQPDGGPAREQEELGAEA